MRSVSGLIWNLFTYRKRCSIEQFGRTAELLLFSHKFYNEIVKLVQAYLIKSLEREPFSKS
jgi:hypothetical protein